MKYRYECCVCITHHVTALSHTVNVCYFRWGKISRKYWQDISRGGNFRDTATISFIKVHWFNFRVGVIFAKKTKARKTQKLPPRENFHVYSTMRLILFFIALKSVRIIWRKKRRCGGMVFSSESHGATDSRNIFRNLFFKYWICFSWRFCRRFVVCCFRTNKRITELEARV